MAEEANGHVDPADPPPVRVMGDYALQQGPRHFSSIVVPNTARAIEIKPAHLTLVSANQFTRMEHEDPYTHFVNILRIDSYHGIRRSG